MNKFRIGERIGGGADNDVYQDADNPDRVIAIRKHGKEDTVDRERKIKARFYLKKILHALFPKNIPDIDRATSNPQATRRTKVKLDPLHEAIQKASEFEIISEPIPLKVQEKSDEASKRIENDPKFKQLLNSLKDIGVEIDSTVCNFTYTENGDAIVYLDDIHFEDADWETENPRGFDEEKLGEAIMNIQDESTRERTLRFFERLKALTL